MKTTTLALPFALALLAPACALDSNAHGDDYAGDDATAFDTAGSTERSDPALATIAGQGSERSSRGSIVRFETPTHDTGAGVTLGQWLDGPAALDDTGAATPAPSHPGPRPETPSAELEARHEARLAALHVAFGCDTTTTGRVLGGDNSIFVGWKDGCTATPLGVEITLTDQGWTVRDEAFYGATVSIERSAPGSDWGFLELTSGDSQERLVLTTTVRFHTTRDVVMSSAIEAIASHEVD